VPICVSFGLPLFRWYIAVMAAKSELSPFLATLISLV
jgi:hypothetical protein